MKFYQRTDSREPVSSISMTLRGWLALLAIYVGYLFLGALLFNAIECPRELAELERQEREDLHLTNKIRTMWNDLKEKKQKELEEILGHWQHRGFIMRDSIEGNKSALEPKVCIQWNQHNSLFFSFTVVTTIGYGHQAPTTTLGRMICIFYALIGIPLNAMLIGSLGNLFKGKMYVFKARLWESLGKAGPLGRQVSQAVVALEDRPKAVAVAAESFVFFLLFFLAFLPIPAIIFTALENKEGIFWEEGDWTFPDSLYYTFITLSTIGFGDMVPDRNLERIRSPVVRRVYLAGIIVWIILGMGYIWGVVEIISGTLKAGSKPVKKALQGLRNQLALDADYWKKIIGEIIVVKHGRQPVPGEELLLGGSGGSQPCIAVQNNSGGPRRALSLGDLVLEAGEDDEQKDFEGITRTASLAQPLPRQESSISGEAVSLTSLDHDTITSLRQFLKTAKLGQERTWAENNLGCDASFLDGSEAETREVSRQGSFKSFGRFHQQHSLLTRNPSNASTAPSMASSRQSRHCNSGVGRLLEETTLGEFLQAVESVRLRESRESVLVGNGSGLQRRSSEPLVLNGVRNARVQGGRYCEDIPPV